MLCRVLMNVTNLSGAQPADVLDIDRLEMLVGLQEEGSDLLPQLVGLFKTETREWLVEANHALDAGEPAELARIGHNIKGTSGTLGATSLQRLAHQLEQGAAGADAGSLRALVGAITREFDHAVVLLDQFLELKSPR